jgi:hypothetical protein
VQCRRGPGFSVNDALGVTFPGHDATSRTKGRLSSGYEDCERAPGHLFDRQCLLGTVVHTVAGIIFARRGHLVDEEYAMTEVIRVE